MTSEMFLAVTGLFVLAVACWIVFCFWLMRVVQQRFQPDEEISASEHEHAIAEFRRAVSQWEHQQ